MANSKKANTYCRLDVHQFDDDIAQRASRGDFRTEAEISGKAGGGGGGACTNESPPPGFPLKSKAMDMAMEIAMQRLHASKQMLPPLNTVVIDTVMREQSTHGRSPARAESPQAQPEDAMLLERQRTGNLDGLFTSSRTGSSEETISKNATDIGHTQKQLTYADRASTGRTYNNLTGRTAIFKSTTVAKAPSPYEDDMLNPNEGAHITDGELRTALDHLPAPSEKPSDGMRSVHFVGNAAAVRNRMHHLQQRGIVLYTVDFNPSRDQFEAWVDDAIVCNMEIKVEQVKVIARFTFLLVVSTAEERDQILTDAPFYMGNKLVMAMPWAPDFDALTMKISEAPVWIDLPLVHPAMEIYANELLETVGKVVYPATTTSRSRFPHIRGCVLADLNQDLIEYIILELPGVREFKIAVEYRSMPDACFVCRKRGHQARHCPTKKSKESAAPDTTAVVPAQTVADNTAHNQAPAAPKKISPTTEQDGFTNVHARFKPPGTTVASTMRMEPSIVTSNPFALLPDDGEDGEITVPIASPLRSTNDIHTDHFSMPPTADSSNDKGRTTPTKHQTNNVTVIITPMKTQKSHQNCPPSDDPAERLTNEVSTTRNIRKALASPEPGTFCNDKADPVLISNTSLGAKQSKILDDDAVMSDTCLPGVEPPLVIHSTLEPDPPDPAEELMDTNSAEASGQAPPERSEGCKESTTQLLASLTPESAPLEQEDNEELNQSILQRTDHNALKSGKTTKERNRCDGNLKLRISKATWKKPTGKGRMQNSQAL
ncbi:unnamed protein product [Calypogeia fissa]